MVCQVWSQSEDRLDQRGHGVGGDRVVSGVGNAAVFDL